MGPGYCTVIRWAIVSEDYLKKIIKLFSSVFDISSMGQSFDSAQDRPSNIDDILNGLDRYNPETTIVFQDYVTQQCEDRTYDCYANLALLKL